MINPTTILLSLILISQLLIIIKLLQVMPTIDELKTKIADQSAKLDGITTSLTGVKGDIDSLKQQIADLSNGATPAQIQELSDAIDGVSGKVDAIATTSTELDAETP